MCTSNCYQNKVIKTVIVFKVYPDEGNKLKGVLHHVYSTLEAYFERTFDPLDWDDWEKATLYGLRM